MNVNHTHQGSLPLNSACNGTKVPPAAPPKDRRPQMSCDGDIYEYTITKYFTPEKISDYIILSIIYFLRVKVVVGQTVPGNLLPLCSRSAVVAVWVNGDAAAWSEFAPYFDILWIHQLNQIFHNNIHAIFVEISMIPETKEI